jgi:hypothetical protein
MAAGQRVPLQSGLTWIYVSNAKFPTVEEAELLKQQARVPQFAQRAGQKAHSESLRRFGQVVTVRDDQVVRLSSNGMFTVISELRPAIKVPPTMNKAGLKLVSAASKKP